jgi:hypothetical protein
MVKFSTPNMIGRKEFGVSVYGRARVKKRRLVITKHPRYKVKHYYRTVTVWEERRWDLQGAGRELWKAVAYIKRRKASPKIRHQRINARTFLMNPDKWIDEYEMEGTVES